MSEITIKSKRVIFTGWSKDIRFEREGETHLVTLYWNINDGYDITFQSGDGLTPDWAWEMIEVNNGDEDIYEILDNLTERAGE